MSCNFVRHFCKACGVGYNCLKWQLKIWLEGATTYLFNIYYYLFRKEMKGNAGVLNGVEYSQIVLSVLF